jgi:hypothetical protein
MTTRDLKGWGGGVAVIIRVCGEADHVPEAMAGGGKEKGGGLGRASHRQRERGPSSHTTALKTLARRRLPSFLSTLLRGN